MAYVLRKVPEKSKTLEKLSVKCFKSRLALVQDFCIRFERGEGFLLSDSPDSHSVQSTDEVIETILLGRPGSNQKQIVELARENDLSKHQVEEALKTGSWTTKPGRGREILYYVPDEEFESIEI